MKTTSTVASTAVGALLVSIALGAIGCASTGADVVGREGGVVISDDGRLSLDIPEHALHHDIEITIETIACEQPEAIGPCYAVGPRGTAFSRPALLTYALDDMPLDDVDPHTLGVVAAHDGEWRVLADREVDMVDEIVVSSAMYLSDFAVVPVF